MHSIFNQIDKIHTLLSDLESKTSLIARPLAPTPLAEEAGKTGSPVENELEGIIKRLTALANRL